MAIDKDKLLTAIDAKAEHAYGDDTDSAIARHRASLIEAYLGYNVNPAPPGRSQVVDRSVFQTIQTMLPSLVRIFSFGDDVVKFTPNGPEDEQAAEQTTKYINYVVTQKNPWEQIVSDWILDALVNPNSYAFVYWDDVDCTTREAYEGQTEDQLAVLLQDGEVNVIQHSQYPDEEENAARAQAYQQAMMQYQQMAMQAQQPQPGMPPQDPAMAPQLPPPPPPPEPAFLHDVVLERVETDGRVKICVLPPEHCLVDADTPDWTLEHCDYFEFRQEKTIADLRAMGLDVDENVSDEVDINALPEDHARNRMGESRSLGDDDAETGVMRKVVCRTIWVRCDAEDEEPRLYYVIAVGRTILYAEQTSRIPVSSMTAQPMPHRHPGMSVAEMVMDIQDVKTAIKRGGLDNLYLANNGRYAISDKVNLDDFLDSRPGGAVRLIDGALPGEGHIFPLTHPFAFDSIIGSLEYFDQDGQNRTGASRYFSGTDAGAINKTASGTSMLQNASAQRVEHIARMMSPSFERLFNIVQELISKHQNKGDVIKVSGKWVNVNPTDWKTRRDAKISVGVGAGNKESMMKALTVQGQAQAALMQFGIAKPENLYATVIEHTKLQGFPNPEKFWTDPSKEPPKPPPPSPELLKLQADQQQAQTDAQLEQQRLALEKEKADQQAMLEKYKADLQAQTTLQVKGMDMQAAAASHDLDKHKTLMEADFKSREADLKGKAFEHKSRADVVGMLQKMATGQSTEEKDTEDGVLEFIAQSQQQTAEALQSLAEAVKVLGAPKRRVPMRDKGGRISHVDEVPIA